MSGILKIAIMALGGQGGGVLSGWLTELANDHGWHVQTTSVAGVAQRTGATIYYTEMAPGSGPLPVMALAPAKGDVDIMIAAEAMEAGRAVMRGFVTPDRTTMIASTHRAFATLEKMVPGDGRADEVAVADGTTIAAKRLVAFDMESIAQASGSVISAALFGALAGSGAMPFERTAFKRVVEASGRGVAASLKAFDAAFEQVGQPSPNVKIEQKAAQFAGPDHLLEALSELQARVAKMPDTVQSIVLAGLYKVVDFQDVDYGRDYLDSLGGILSEDSADHDFRLTILAAKYLANAMAYDDVIQVADHKTRPQRFVRIQAEIGNAHLTITDYVHPGAAEVCGLLPSAIGGRIANNPRWLARLDRLVSRGRHVRSDSMTGFGLFFALAGLRRWRRRLYRHQVERGHWESWLALVAETVPADYALACEILACRRLIKGYADTHARGHSKYDRVLAVLPQLQGRTDGADWLRRLREAALQDPDGKALGGALQTLASFRSDQALGNQATA